MSELFNIEPTTSPDAELARARAEYSEAERLLKEAEERGEFMAEALAGCALFDARERLASLERAALARLKH